MVGGPAVGVLAADVEEAADVDTLVPDTRSLSGTLHVADTLQLDTPHEGVTAGAGGTGAHGLVVGGGADGVSSTRAGDVTRVLTLPIEAAGRLGTVVVGQTLVRGLTSPELVWDCSCRTLALVGSDGVDTDGGGLTGTVLTLVNVHTPVGREDVAGLTSAGGDVVGGGAGSSATAHLTTDMLVFSFRSRRLFFVFLCNFVILRKLPTQSEIILFLFA